MSKVTFSQLRPFLSAESLAVFDAFEAQHVYDSQDDAFFAFFSALEGVVCAFPLGSVGSAVERVHDDVSAVFWASCGAL